MRDGVNTINALGIMLPGLPTLIIGVVLVHLLLAALVFRWRWQCRERAPVSDKLLRPPGERLRRRLDRLDERTDQLLLGTLGMSLTALSTGFWLLPNVTAGGPQIGALAGTLFAFVAVAAAGAWLLKRTLDERRQARRALQGELTVASILDPLTAKGYYIFHDVPADSDKPEDNIHHVVLGPSGIFAIETQTHARHKALPGRKDHEIVFDGDQIVYPWGEDTRGIVPARSKAEWLSDWIFQTVGDRIRVSAVLTFPGWWVTPYHQRDIRVSNPSQIRAQILEAAPAGNLGEQRLELIVRQLDTRCRDVEF